MPLRSTGLERVIEKRLCTLYGACIAVCPRGMLVSTTTDYGFIARTAYKFTRDYGCLLCGICYD